MMREDLLGPAVPVVFHLILPMPVTSGVNGVDSPRQ